MLQACRETLAFSTPRPWRTKSYRYVSQRGTSNMYLEWLGGVIDREDLPLTIWMKYGSTSKLSTPQELEYAGAVCALFGHHREKPTSIINNFNRQCIIYCKPVRADLSLYLHTPLITRCRLLSTTNLACKYDKVVTLRKDKGKEQGWRRGRRSTCNFFDLRK